MEENGSCPLLPSHLKLDCAHGGDVILLSPRTSALLTHRSGFMSIPVTSLCIRYPGPFSCHASRFPVDKSLCLSIWSIKCCKFCDEGQSIKFLKRVCVSYRGAASMLLTVFDSYWRKIDDLNPPHIRASLLTSLLLSHTPPPFFFFLCLPIQFIKHAFSNQRLENCFHLWGRYSVSFYQDVQFLILWRKAKEAGAVA